MEMHHVRYFLAVAETLNFTHAARKCGISQPSLTRAIKKLEEELDGPLLRRERSHTHLTELGRAMLPLLQQCYDSALAAKTLAEMHSRGSCTPLRIAISHTVEMDFLAGHLRELNRAFPELELEYFRRTATEIVELLKEGDVELAIAGPLGDDWDRLDRRSLFDEEFVVVVNNEHPIAEKDRLEVSGFADFPFLSRPYCEYSDDIHAFLNRKGIVAKPGQVMKDDCDLISLVKVGLGAGLVPRSLGTGRDLSVIPVADVDIRRSVYLYTVAGRQRTAAGAAFIGLLRSADRSSDVVVSQLAETGASM